MLNVPEVHRGTDVNDLTQRYTTCPAETKKKS